MQKINITSLVRNFLCQCSKAQATRIWFCLNLEIFCPFYKKSASTRCVFELVLSVNMQLKTVPSLMGVCAFTGIQLRDVIVFNNLCFILPYEYRKTVRHLHTGERFWKDAFLVARFHRIRVDSRPNRRKKSPFSIKNSKPCICLFACFFISLSFFVYNKIRPFSRWRHLTTTTRIHFGFCFVIEICQSGWGLKKNSPNLYKKTTNWRILVVVVKWRHRAIVLLSWLISESLERALCFSNLLLLPELIFQ